MRILILAPLLALTALPAMAQATADLDFTLTNASQLTVAEFYTSPAVLQSWGDNVLAGSALPPGGTGTVTIAQGADQCVYDMKFIFADGSEFIDQGIDLCKAAEYTLSDR